MVIKFTCPCDKNRRMQVPADRGGKNAKCPECGLPFVIPRPDPNLPAGTLPKAEELLEFLCPNEQCPKQLLQAPASMAGRRGQCPHCGSKFRVPRPEDLRGRDEEGQTMAEAAGDSGVQDSADSFGRAVAEARATDLVEDVEEIQEVEEADAVAEPAEASAAASDSNTGSAPQLDFQFLEQQSALADEASMHGSDYIPPGAVNEHPMAALFERIWDESDREAIVELRLSTGEMITPVHYAHDFSRGQHGIFGLIDRDGKHVLEVIPWENVARVTVRGLSELPPTLFDVPNG